MPHMFHVTVLQLLIKTILEVSLDVYNEMQPEPKGSYFVCRKSHFTGSLSSSPSLPTTSSTDIY